MKENAATKYFVDSYNELKKVTWPTKKQLLNHSLIVVVSAIVVTLIIAIIDLGLTSLLQYLVSKQG